MMREILLSFKPSVYEKIKAGEKIFEYRRMFPNEEILAYMYVSSPRKCITGIIILGKRIDLNVWYKSFESIEVKNRIYSYMQKSKYVMPIISFQETTEISLEELRNIDEFVVPQMYIYLEKYPELREFINSKLLKKELKFINSFESINEDMICQ